MKNDFSKDIINSHDSLFKSIFSNKKNAIDFFNNYLPKNIINLIDFSHTEIIKDSFVDKQLKQHFSDLLYKIKIKNKTGFIYFLFEHKSYPDKFVSFQLLKYLVNIWNSLIKQNKIKDKLPLIIPIVFYHGVKKWNIDKRFSYLFDIPDKNLLRYIPEYEYILYDLSSMSDDRIKGNILNQIHMLLFKYIHREEFSEKFVKIVRLLAKLLEKESGLEYIETILRYVVSSAEYIDEDQLRDIIEKNLKGGEFSMSTLAEKWFNQGIEKGRQEGRQEGIRKGLIDGIKLSLKLKFGDQAKAIYSYIESIEDINILKIIMNSIEKAKDIEDIKRIYNN